MDESRNLLIKMWNIEKKHIKNTDSHKKKTCSKIHCVSEPTRLIEEDVLAAVLL